MYCVTFIAFTDSGWEHCEEVFDYWDDAVDFANRHYRELRGWTATLAGVEKYK